MNRIIFKSVSIAFFVMALWGCGNTPTQVTDGGGSEVEIIGKLRNMDGTPATDARVYLRPSDYLPDVAAKTAARLSLKSLDSTFTDSLGQFSFDSIAPGTYTLECLDGEPGNGALIDSVVIENPDSTIELATDTLKPLGAIAGQIQLPESLDASQVRVRIYGLDRVTTPDSTGAYVFSGLAEGEYSLRFQILAGDEQDLNNIAVASGDTTVPSQISLLGAGRIYAPKTSGPITLDGVFDEADWSTTQEINFSRPGYTENTARAKALWDYQNLYFAYEIKDSLLGMDSLSPWNRCDGVEIFLDPEHNAVSGMDTSDLQIVINIRGEVEVIKEPFHQVTPTLSVAVDTTATGYNMEIAIPWTFIGKSPQTGLVMGALFGNDDRDGDTALQFGWLDPADSLMDWRNSSLWGDLILK